MKIEYSPPRMRRHSCQIKSKNYSALLTFFTEAFRLVVNLIIICLD